MAKTEKLLLDIQVKNQQALGRLNSQINQLQGSSLKLGTLLKGAAAGLAAIGATKVVGSIISTTARFEDLNDSLASVTGSAQAGAEAFDFVSKFATQTQFGVEDLTTTFIKLKASGIEPTADLLTLFTDTAAITTDQLGSLEAITDLFARTTSGGLGLEELNRLADRGVPVFRILEEQLGLTRLEISNVGKTSEGSQRILNALSKGIRQDFGGATAKVTDNLSTQFSNFGIALKNVANEFGTALSPTLKEATAGLTSFLETNQEAIGAIGEFVATALGALLSALGKVAKAFIAVVDGGRKFVNVIKESIGLGKQEVDLSDKRVQNLRAMHQGYVAVTKEIKKQNKETKEAVSVNDTLIRKQQEAEQTAEQMAEAQKKITEAVKANQTPLEAFIDGFTGAGGAFDALDSFRKAGENAFNGMADLVTNFVMTGKLNFKDFARSVIADLVRIAAQAAITFAIKAALKALGGPVGGFISGFLADGGTAQAGRSYIVGERGPELFVPRSTGTVVPNEAMGAAVGGEVTVNFNINAVDAAGFDELLLSRKNLIVGTIQQAFRQQGRRFA
jgi:phage tail tape-measure protein